VSAITVLVCDDQPLARAGIRRVIEADPSLRVIGEAGDGQEAVGLTRALRPDVVLMDIRMPILDGIEATTRLVDAGTHARIVVLTTFGLDEYVLGALRAGASGFVLKEAPPEDILTAIHTVARGDALISPAVTHAVIEELGRRPVRSDLATKLETLTPREREVLGLLARGLSNAEIAGDLVVGEGTVKTHVAHVLAKLGVRDRVQAVVFAYESGAV
jgi:DNA-binding NarL/FixJ family response regulator